MSRTLLVFLLFILFLNVVCPLFGQPSSKVMESSGSVNDRTAKIFARNAIEKEARRLAEAGFYDQAVQKFQEAIRPELINREAEKGFSLWSILQIHQWQGKYGLALEELQWFLKMRPDKENYQDKKLELEALIKARDTKSSQPIYEHIRYLRERYKNQLPPKEYVASFSPTITSTIIRLYDHIGDLDGGIAFCDELINLHLRDSKKYGVQDQARDPYFVIKQAFLEDKKAGTKGRATKALIQSDYFPW